MGVVCLSTLQSPAAKCLPPILCLHAVLSVFTLCGMHGPQHTCKHLITVPNIGFFARQPLHYSHESLSRRQTTASNRNLPPQCRETLDALGGHYVLNSGTFLGPSKLLLTYIDAMLEELQHRWHCRRLHGTDQAIHNFLVYTGKFIGTGMCSSAPPFGLQCSLSDDIALSLADHSVCVLVLCTASEV